MAEDELADVRQLRPERSADGIVGVGRGVLAGLEDLLPLMGDAYRREVVEYAALGPDDFAHVIETSKAFIGSFVDDLANGVDHPVPDHGRLLDAGRLRQQRGVSLDAAMHAFRIASRVGWTAIADFAKATDPLLVSELAGRWIEYVDRAATAFAEGHTTAATEQLRRVDARRQALVADLLSSEDEAAARAVGARHGLRMAEFYVPVLMGTSESFAVQDRVQPLLPLGSLLGVRADHVLVLVPVGSPAGPLPSLAQVLGDGPLAHGRPAKLGPSLVVEVARAESILAAALSLGRVGPHGPNDLLLERVVVEHEGLAAHLEDNVLRRLQDADDNGVFRETLRAYLASGAIRAVADHLFVHANTVTYRLRRIREITGLDARVPQQAAHLVLAMAREDVAGNSTKEADA